jgi:hypothetical protein
VDFFSFTDEKMFAMAAPSNAQNDRLNALQSSRKKEIAADRLLWTRATFSKSIMVSIIAYKLDRTDLVFIETGVKINETYYRDEYVLLNKELLPTIRQISGDMFFLQQDSALAYRTGETLEFQKRETPANEGPVEDILSISCCLVHVAIWFLVLTVKEFSKSFSIFWSYGAVRVLVKRCWTAVLQD